MEDPRGKTRTSALDLVKILEEEVRTLATNRDDSEGTLSTEDVEYLCDNLSTLLYLALGALNPRRWINRFPEEILIKIFAFVPSPEWLEDKDSDIICGPYQWTDVSKLEPVSRVCRYWWRVALDVSALWSSAMLVSPGSSSRGGPSYLHRCKYGPVSLRTVEEQCAGRDDGEHGPWTLSGLELVILNKHAARLRELHVRMPTGWQGPILPSSLSVSAPKIERLSIHSNQHGRGPLWRGLFPIHGGGELSLKSMSLRNIAFFPSNQLPFLTRLFISFNDHKLRRSSGSDRVARDLLVFLANAPEAFLHGLPLSPEPHLRQVTLNYLRKLSIQTIGVPDHSHLLLSSIVFPMSCYVRLVVCSPHALSSLSSYLLRGASGRRMHCAFDLRVSSVNVQTTNITAGGLQIDLPSYRRAADEYSATFSRCLPMSTIFPQIRYLWITGFGINHGARDGFLPALLSMPNVEELYIHHSDWKPPAVFIDSLKCHVGGLTPFPLLTTLYLHIYNRGDLEQVVTMLRSRRDGGCRLRDLILGFDFEIPRDFPGARQDPENEMWEALEGVVASLKVVTEDDYQRQYSLRANLQDDKSTYIQTIDMTQSPLTILELINILAVKADDDDDDEFAKLSTEEIESACARLSDVFAAVRRASNSRTRVNSLPPEILLKIFAFVPHAPELTVFDTVQSVCGPLNIRKAWELRAITQVCHRWRSLALDVSSLWSSGFRVPHWGSRCGDIPNDANFLPRCAVGPIQIYVEEDGLAGSNWQTLKSIKAPPDYEDRVEELHVITLDGWKKRGLLPSSLSSPRMGSLQRLVVRSLHFGNSVGMSWKWLGLQSLFSGQTLRLRSLAIIDSPFLPSNPVPALTHLVLFYRMKREMRDTWSIQDLLLFLSATPTLEEVVICGVPQDDIATGRLPTAHLSNLRKLSIRAWDYWAAPSAPGLPSQLFSNLVIPQSCYLRLDAARAKHIRALALHFQSRQWDVPASNVHCVWDSSPYTLSSLQATFPSSGGGIRLDFPTVQELDMDLGLAEALHSLAETPPFAAAEALWVSGSGINTAWDTRMVHSLSTLVSARALYIVNDPLCEPVKFITSLGEPDQAQVSFPNLETIYVQVYDLDSVERLADMLRRRADLGCKIDHLLVAVAYAGMDAEEGPVVTEEVRSLASGIVEKVTVLSENDYRQAHSLRTVLPPICTLPGGGLIWTPWTENEATFSLMEIT